MEQFSRVLPLVVWLLLLVAVEADVCPGSPEAEGISDDVIRAVCSYFVYSPQATSFRNETRHRHGVFDGVDKNNHVALAQFFHPIVTMMKCSSSCKDVARENVKWCVRIADANRTIETCISVDDDEELLVESTCDARSLGLDAYITLPTTNECGSWGAGCLGLVNLNWFMKDAYFTCISKTDNCSNVNFTQIVTVPGNNKPPTISEITASPLKVKPNGQVIIRAEILSDSTTTSVSWRHGNTTYVEYLQEDPICDSAREGECGNHTHPDGDKLRSQRVRFYVMSRKLNSECVGSSVYSLETYLIVDNATEADAGVYVVNVKNIVQSVSLDDQVNVTVVCDDAPLYIAKCSNYTIAMQKGSNTKWHCTFIAPVGLEIAVFQNKKSVKVEHSDLDGKESLDSFCTCKEPTVIYDVEEVEEVCYSKYTVNVIVCAVSEEVVGNYSVWGQEKEVEQSSVFVKIPSTALAHSSGKTGTYISPAAYAVPVVVLIVALGGIFVVLVVLIRMKKRRRRQGHLSELQSPDPIMSPEAAFYKKSGQFSPISLLSPQSTSAAFSDPLEFPRNQLYVYTKKVLGEGSFGRVLQAKAEGIVPGMPERNIVAIKTTKDNATSVEIEELLGELDLMRNMTPHENILNLLGQCTTPGGPVCLIVEYAKYGNLRDFLRQCEEVVLSLNHKPHIPRHRSRTGTFSSSSAGSFQPLITRQDSSVFTPGSVQHQFVFPFPSPPSHKMSTGSSSSTTESKAAAHHPSTAVPLAHSVAPIGHDYINSKGLVYMEDVHNFALQIACGLQHLASMEIVHCDLAARNVLIAEGFVLKIADFGLARDISGREMYKKNPRGKIPVKWTAPEALENRIFTTKSDVWSFGVVLWELFTYGHSPYPDLHLGQSYDAIVTYLKEGNRMAQPDSCSDEFYELMLKCWFLDPDERPTPIDIVATLTPLDGPLHDDNGLNMPEDECKSKPIEENAIHLS
ncbi:Vascular endothelial growth factor receptor 3 [Geodia barretti]|nr:Vascular endothelial growth factor receptor 3 [Geodia barretti]